MNVLIDGIAFQQDATGAGWGTGLAQLATDGSWQLHVLDRGGSPQVAGVIPIPFPSSNGADCAADSVLIQRICDLYRIDAFISTGTTTPLTTPSVAFVHDLMADLLATPASGDRAAERQTALAHALHCVCPSERLRSDLLALWPEVPAQQVHVVVPAVDAERFRPADARSPSTPLRGPGRDRPYLLVAAQAGPALAEDPRRDDVLIRTLARGGFDLDLLWLQGEPRLGAALASALPPRIALRTINPAPDEWPRLLAEAFALLCVTVDSPLLPLQAMAMGCPVIVLGDEPVPELAGGLSVSVRSVDETALRSSFEVLCDPTRRAEQSLQGMAHAQSHGPDEYVAGVRAVVAQAVADARSGRYDGFYREWKRLRLIQANVDFPVPR